jgi:hypothetical protein
MRQKLHAPPEVQLLVNTVMEWAENKLRNVAHIPAAAAWLPQSSAEPQFRAATADGLSLAEQESDLLRSLEWMWQGGELAAVLLAAPVLYGRGSSGERSEAIRLHVEAAQGYCADIFMPYRIRAASRWRGRAQNRVHFSHPVAQESDSRFGASPARA